MQAESWGIIQVMARSAIATISAVWMPLFFIHRIVSLPVPMQAGSRGGNGYGTLGEDCYYLNLASKVGVGTGEDNTVSCTMEQMRSQATFSGFDFDAIWTMSGNETYPYPELQKMFHADVQEENVTEFNGGTGAQYAPYLIANKEHLNNVRNHLGAYFKMVADIHFTTDDFAENGFFTMTARAGSRLEQVKTRSLASLMALIIPFMD